METIQEKEDHTFWNTQPVPQNSVASAIYAQIIQQNVMQKIMALETYLNA